MYPDISLNPWGGGLEGGAVSLPPDQMLIVNN